MITDKPTKAKTNNAELNTQGLTNKLNAGVHRRRAKKTDKDRKWKLKHDSLEALQSRPTLAAVFLITVVHAVQHVITAPAPRDTVSTIQAEELVLPALLHTANLTREKHQES